MDNGEARAQVARIEKLLDEIESLTDATARATAAEAVQALLELYGEGLARVMESIASIASSTGEQGGEQAGERIMEDLAADELVSHLLLLHGLHPLDLETRVQRALEEVRPYLGSHGGNVELLGMTDGVARLRLQGSCHGCPSSSMTLQLAIEDALQRAAPDLEGLEVEGLVEPQARQDLLFLDGPVTREQAGAARSASSWAAAGGLAQLAGGSMLVKEIAGEPLLFLRVAEAFYAYRSRCPGCGAPLGQGGLEGAQLRCGGCRLAFDVTKAGRCLGDGSLFLEPVPLLLDREGTVKVALATAAG